MNGFLWRNLIVMLPAFLAMLYGIIRIFPRTKGLYFRMGVLGMACLFAGFLYSLTAYLTGVSTGGMVNIGLLGNIGLALFLMTQNADSVSTILYEQGKNHQKKVSFAAVSPILILAIWFVCELFQYYRTENHNFQYWFGTVFGLGICAVFNAITAFYTLRYALSEDGESGLVSCLRPHNRLMTVLLILLTPEYFVHNMTVETTVGFAAILTYYMILAVCIVSVLPLMERGRAKFLASL